MFTFLNICYEKNRNLNEIRKVEIIPNYTSNSDGSALIKFGNTWVLCTANIESGVPCFKRKRYWMAYS